jgi:hypothetical protein
MDQLVMSQIGVNGLTVLLSVTLAQEQGTGIMNTQTEALIVLMTFMKLILAEVMKQIAHLQESLSITMDNMDNNLK